MIGPADAADFHPSGHDIVVGKPFVEPPPHVQVVEPDDPRLAWDRNGFPYLTDVVEGGES